MSAPDVHDVAATRLRSVQQRYTDGRRRIVDALATAPRPLTIPELMAQDEHLAQSSAYRNLQLLEQVGVVHRVVTADEHGRFELAEELSGHHHHLICTGCGRVDDFTAPPELEATLDAALATVANGSRFELTGHRLDLIGRCATCR